MDKELEEIINKINENFSNKLSMSKPHEDGLFVVFRDDIKYAEFKGEFGRNARSMKELKPLFDYINNNGYKTNLD